MDKSTKVGLFRSLLLARVFEEKKIELADEIAETDIKPTSCIGQEATMSIGRKPGMSHGRPS